MSLARSRTVASLALLAGAASGFVTACGQSGAGDVPLASSMTDEEIARIPTPAKDGPRLLITHDTTKIVDRPAPAGRPIGELRAGATLPRSPIAYGTVGCEGGWYAVAPRGFVCVGDRATLDLIPQQSYPKGPDLTRPMPYRYGRARADGVPVYAGLPSARDQATGEQDAARAETARDGELIGAGANDVPLDARGVPTGPPVLETGVEGVNDKGRRTSDAWFAFGELTALAPRADGQSGKIGTLHKGSALVLAGTVIGEGIAGPRRFGVTPDGRTVPVDRMKPALGSVWHGVDLEKMPLPIAFVQRMDAFTWKLERGQKPERTDEELERRIPIAMSGRYATIDGVRYEQTRDGAWVRALDVAPIVKRTKFPEYATEGRKWLDVSLVHQTMTAYEGKKAVYATLISSGRELTGDAHKMEARALPILAKYVTKAVDPREVSQSFEVTEAPWVLELGPGIALTGAYWTEAVGVVDGHLNITLTPIDARHLWLWAGPDLPEGWHGVLDPGAEPTMVNLRP